MVLKSGQEKRYVQMRNSVFEHMLRTRGWKYRPVAVGHEGIGHGYITGTGYGRCSSNPYL